MNAMSAGGATGAAEAGDRWSHRSLWSVVSRPRVVVAVLAPVAVGEAAWRAAGANLSPPYGFLLCLLAFLTAVPAAFLGVRAAAVVTTVAAVLSMVPFDSLTVAGAAGELYVLHRLRHGSPVLPVALALPFAALALVAAARDGPSVLGVFLATAAPAAALAGVARTAREQARLHQRARQLVTADLADHVARGERARIARDLHDVVAHHITMIVAQSEAARLTTPGMPEAGAQHLAQIRDLARAGLLEMRRLLGVLREDVGAVQPERRPQPGLAQLHELVDHARAASGAVTRLIVSGAPVALDPGVELVAYRIVQEALTNARRHAPGVAVDVELRYSDDGVRVRVRDNGPGPVGGGLPDGHGLLGMRERAAAVGGRLRAGPATVGGFMVEATLPAKAEVMG
jgi:signal transduction histidine kinase